MVLPAWRPSSTRKALRAPVNVLIEIGHTGGRARAGCRTLDEVSAVADAIGRSPSLRLAGVEAFEGTIDDHATPVRTTDGKGTRQAVDALLARVTASARMLSERGLFDTEQEIVVSAGGSAFFDFVVDAFTPLRNELPRLLLVLRSGSYVTHDGGYYARTSPLNQLAQTGSPSLQAALELWSAVLSRPEPDLAIIGAGKRDLPIDMGLPTPTRTWNASRGMRPLSSPGATVSGVSDQHIHLRIDSDTRLEVGDLCAWTISHPCTAFDKWQPSRLSTTSSRSSMRSEPSSRRRRWTKNSHNSSGSASGDSASRAERACANRPLSPA